MSETVPDWLARRDGSVVLAPDKITRFVLLGGKPQYSLTPRPADGKHSCVINQTVNGRRLDTGEIYSSNDEAIRGGLEKLRHSLGW